MQDFNNSAQDQPNIPEIIRKLNSPTNVFTSVHYPLDSDTAKRANIGTHLGNNHNLIRGAALLIIAAAEGQIDRNLLGASLSTLLFSSDKPDLFYKGYTEEETKASEKAVKVAAGINDELLPLISVLLKKVKTGDTLPLKLDAPPLSVTEEDIFTLDTAIDAWLEAIKRDAKLSPDSTPLQQFAKDAEAVAEYIGAKFSQLAYSPETRYVVSAAPQAPQT